GSTGQDVAAEQGVAGEMTRVKGLHKGIERRVAELEGHLSLTGEEQIERARLKKEKMWGKERLGALAGHVKAACTRAPAVAAVAIPSIWRRSSACGARGSGSIETVSFSMKASPCGTRGCGRRCFGGSIAATTAAPSFASTSAGSPTSTSTTRRWWRGRRAGTA